MATTKIWPIKDNLKRVVNYAGNPAKTEYNDLEMALHYAGNDNKTVSKSSENEQVYFVSGVNCTAETAFEEMTAIKERFGKTGGNVAYHAYQSFLPGEVTPKLCHDIGVKLATNLWGNRFQVLVATHLDKGHLHNHFVINSVSYMNGKKFNDNLDAYYSMRDESDILCRKYQLSVIKNPAGKTPRSIYFAEKKGEPTTFNLMREAIDTALKISANRQDFKQALRDMGYFLNDDENRKYATICRVGSKKAVRLFRLVEEYDLPAINITLRENYYRHGSYLYNKTQLYELKHFSTPTRYEFYGTFNKTKKVGGLRGLYLHYCYLLGVFPKVKHHQPLSPELREACRKMDEFSRQVRLICWHKLNTTNDVQGFISDEKSQMNELTEKRQKLYNRLRRCDDPAEIAKIKALRDALTEKLQAHRKDIKTAENILDRAEQMKQEIRKEKEMQAAKQERIRQAATKHKNQERGYER